LSGFRPPLLLHKSAYRLESRHPRSRFIRSHIRQAQVISGRQVTGLTIPVITGILPPRVGFLWTPGYWAFNGTNYFFNQGYWGPTVGFYGGINYGWGYGGVGYYGGRWVGNTFSYNRAVTRVNTTVIHNTYVNRQVVRNTGNGASFNGPGGTTAKATAQQEAAAKAEHIPATSAQQSRLEAAKNNPDLQVANNQGKPKAEAIKAFDRNNGTAQAEAGKGKGNASEEAGNSAFGQKQGDATTRTKGSQNNAYGKAQSAEAHTKSKSHANKVATTHHTSRQAQVTPHRQQSMLVQRGGSASSTHGKGQSAQSDKKKKKPENQGPGH
jgi:hypothetical protein